MTVHSEGVHLKELGIGESQKITQQSKASKSGANLLTLKSRGGDSAGIQKQSHVKRCLERSSDLQTAQDRS